MKVHIVMRYDSHYDSEGKIIAIYLDEIKAEERTLKEQHNDRYHIYEYETHEVQE